MKKLVFAFQMFGVIAMFPLYVIVEFNHAKRTLPEQNPSSVIEKKQGDNSLHPRSKNEDAVFVMGENKQSIK